MSITITEYDSGRPTLIEFVGPINSQQLNEAMATARERNPGVGIHVRGPGPTAVLDGGGTESYAIKVPRAAKAQPTQTRSEPPVPRNRAERRAAQRGKP